MNPTGWIRPQYGRLFLYAGVAVAVGVPIIALVSRAQAAPKTASPTPTSGSLGASSNQALQAAYGPLEFIHTPQPGNPEAITITNGWDKANVVSVYVPGLNKTIPFHRKGVDRLVALWQAWTDAGLIPLVKSFDGSYNPRLVRGSTTQLSNHAFAVGFDINARWNQMGSPPAPEGAEGTVLPLVPYAEAMGWRWGGRFTRADGMHFELTA